jgi:hypothetical protein
MVERNIKTIKDMLSTFIDNTQKNWDVYLPLLMMAYRSSVQFMSQLSPCSMMLGREITLLVDSVLGKRGTPKRDTTLSTRTFATVFAHWSLVAKA